MTTHRPNRGPNGALPAALIAQLNGRGAAPIDLKESYEAALSNCTDDNLTARAKSLIAEAPHARPNISDLGRKDLRGPVGALPQRIIPANVVALDKLIGKHFTGSASGESGPQAQLVKAATAYATELFYTGKGSETKAIPVAALT